MFGQKRWVWLGIRPEIVLVAAGGLALFGAYAWATRYRVDLMDEGYFLDLADRVYRGELPYRDFDTYYTPGVFYLYAGLFKLFGVSVVPIRLLLAGLRTGCGLLLYGLTRRVAAWPFALLPGLAVAAVDPVPIAPEPHPAWLALLGGLLALASIERHWSGRGEAWIVLAGASAGLAFLFKQNVGVFVALATAGYVMLRQRSRVGPLLQAGRVGFALALGLATAILLRPVPDPVLVGVVIWLPLMVTLALLLWLERGATGARGWRDGLGGVVREGGLAGAAFVLVTLAWLAPLVIALGPSRVPFGLFVGQVNQGALMLPLELPPLATREVAWLAIWLPIGFGLAATRGRARPGRPLLAAALVASLLAALVPVRTELSDPLSDDPTFAPWLTELHIELGSLSLYLAALSAWGALLALAVRLAPGAALGVVPWYVFFGLLANLAFYPRFDLYHAVFGGAPLLVAGAWALSRAHGALATRSGPLGRAVVFASLLIVPTAAVLPHVAWRYVTLVDSDPRAAEPPPYVPLGLERAPLLAPRHIVESVRGATDYVRAGTPPGEPFFAYPAAPLFNFLADRPNPTRFDHFLAGALTPDDLTGVIDRLETTRPRYVLWDHSGVVGWRTDPEYRPLSDYIWRCYRQVANFSPFLVLERAEC